MKKMRILPLVLVAMLILGMVFSFAGCKTESKTIKIGLIMPMTGRVSVYGVSTSNAVKLAVDDINKAGGILGKQIELVIEDDENSPEKAVNAYKKLTTQDKVDVIIGSVGSTPTKAIAPLAQKDGIPLITSAGTQDVITTFGDYIFRACYADSFQGKVCAKFALENLKLTKAAIMTDNGNVYSKGLSDEFEKNFTAAGGTITDKEAYTSTDTNFDTIVAKIKATNPEIIFVPDYYDKDDLIAKSIRAAGMKDVILLGGDGWDGSVGYSKGLDEVGTYFSNHYDPAVSDPDVKAFVDKYKAAYNNEVPNALSALGYDAAQIVLKAIVAAGSTDHAAIRDAMAKTNGKFVTGQISYDASHNPVKAVVMVALVEENGQLAAKYYSTINP